MARPLLLDAYCGAGGCARGYTDAGFDVVGVDLQPQSRYLKSGAIEFHQSDAIEFIERHGREFDCIHCSPPCQAYSVTKTIWQREHPDLLAPTREALIATNRHWIIENVVGAPMSDAITLCGTMFGLRLYRHRLFESSVLLLQPPHQKHRAKCTVVGRRPKADEFLTVAGHFSDVPAARAAMQIDWMTRDELSQAIPPAYCAFVGSFLLAALTATESAA